MILMKYVHASKGATFALIVFAVVAYLVPGGGQSEGVQLLFGVSTFLFAILVGFYLSRTNARFDQVRELIAVEDAKWMNIHDMSKYLSTDFQEKSVDIIDNYYIAAFDYQIGDHHRETEKYINQFQEILMNEHEGDFKTNDAFGNISDQLAAIEESRSKISVICLEKLTRGQWGILFALAGIIIFSIFYLKSPELASNVIAVLLATVLVLVFLIMRDLQNFFLGGKGMVEESSQEVFEEIGRLRYYSKQYLKTHKVTFPRNIKEYRVGYHDVYANHDTPHDIRVFKVGDPVT